MRNVCAAQDIPLAQRSGKHYTLRVEYNSSNSVYGTAARFLDERVAKGYASFSLDDLVEKTGLSVIAARNQLLRLGNRTVRVSQRQQYFLIVSPEHRVFGSPPVEWWLDDYMRWLRRPYYLALLSAATTFGSSQQAVQQTQVITDIPRRDIKVGRILIKFFMKAGVKSTEVQQLQNAYAPLVVSTLESTVYDLIRYAHSLGGVERMTETIAPLLADMKITALRQVLDAEKEVATAQRLGFVLETLGANKFAECVFEWLPKKLLPALLAPHGKNSGEVLPHPKWRIINNTKAFS